MQLKKRARKEGFKALKAAGQPTCDLCHRSLEMEGARCKYRKCPSNAKRRERTEQDDNDKDMGEDYTEE